MLWTKVKSWLLYVSFGSHDVASTWFLWLGKILPSFCVHELKSIHFCFLECFHFLVVFLCRMYMRSTYICLDVVEVVHQTVHCTSLEVAWSPFHLYVSTFFCGIVAQFDIYNLQKSSEKKFVGKIIFACKFFFIFVRTYCY